MCPENQKLGEFVDNVAHSNGRYGLRLFHNHIPRTKQCAAINYDKDSASYNPPIPAQYKNLVSYKNKRNGAIVERAGAIEWINFKVADNMEVGMEMSRTDDNKQGGWAKITGGLVIGKSENTEEALEKKENQGRILFAYNPDDIGPFVTYIVDSHLQSIRVSATHGEMTVFTESGSSQVEEETGADI